MADGSCQSAERAELEAELRQALVRFSPLATEKGLSLIGSRGRRRNRRPWGRLYSGSAALYPGHGTPTSARRWRATSSSPTARGPTQPPGGARARALYSRARRVRPPLQRTPRPPHLSRSHPVRSSLPHSPAGPRPSATRRRARAGGRGNISRFDSPREGCCLGQAYASGCSGPGRRPLAGCSVVEKI